MNETLKVANNVITGLREMDDTTWQVISRTTALGTAAALTFGVYKIGTTAFLFYRGAKIRANETIAKHNAALALQKTATTGATAAIAAETTAININTAAKVKNATVTKGKAAVVASAMTQKELNNSKTNYLDWINV
jgi:hypothetical protein